MQLNHRRLALSALLSLASVTCSAKSVFSQAFLISGYGDTVYSSYLHEDGRVESPQVVAEQAKPSFLEVHPSLPIVYVVSETMRNDPKQPAHVIAYRIDRNQEGKIAELAEVSRQPIDGDIACHVSVDSKGRVLVVSNYINGSVIVYPLDQAGRILRESNNVVHAIPEGKSRSNAHCSVFSPDEKHLLVCDLGLDQVFVYPVDYKNNALDVENAKHLGLPKGAGPRHLTFHPNGELVFIINELNMTLTSAKWDPSSGALAILDTVDTVPSGLDREGFSTAEVLVHPSGKFVYGSNRGHNSIALFHIDENSGKLERVETYSTGGKTPRNFRIDPKGQYLLAENQASDSIVVFKIDQKSGALTATENTLTAKSPTCIKFLKP